MVKNLGFPDDKVIFVYIFYNLVYALSAFPIGILADKIGFKNNYIIGLVLFAVVYASMAMDTGIPDFYSSFSLRSVCILYGRRFKAWITNISDKKDTATALGFIRG
ncbi:MAG: hypothetical protein R3A12_00785 [Ignavibacteria bacterium]